MNISKASASTNMAVSGKCDSLVASLQKQKEHVQKQIETVRASEQDPKTKTKTIAELNAQIAEIDQQIMKAQTDARKREMEEAQEKAAAKEAMKKSEQEKEDENQGVILSSSLNKLLSVNKCSSEFNSLHAVRNKLIGEKNVAQAEINIGHRGGSTKYQSDVVSSTDGKLAKIARDMGEKADEIQRDLKNSVKTGIHDAEKSRENKNKVKKDQEENPEVPNNSDKIASEQDAESINTSNTVPEETPDEKQKKHSSKSQSIDVLI
ncbi:hypothetical protein SRRS_41780 [Sporomusa rhizae]|uniref:FlxA-like family protein n=1 Tax=Sporomusa rhizae TaxID=357999 RepID=UPI00352B3F2A